MHPKPPFVLNKASQKLLQAIGGAAQPTSLLRAHTHTYIHTDHQRAAVSEDSGYNSWVAQSQVSLPGQGGRRVEGEATKEGRAEPGCAFACNTALRERESAVVRLCSWSDKRSVLLLLRLRVWGGWLAGRPARFVLLEKAAQRKTRGQQIAMTGGSGGHPGSQEWGEQR